LACGYDTLAKVKQSAQLHLHGAKTVALATMSAVVGPSLNGATTAPSNNINEIFEYEKIIKLRDQIFAGSHPRLTVPAHAIRKVSPQAPSRPQVLPFSSEPSNVKLPGLQLTTNATRQTPSTISPLKTFPAQPAVSNPQPAQPTISGIDPVLLTKSDDLVRAETHLQRQRLERSLKDQFERKRTEARRWPNPQEAKPDFDLSAALARALEVAKPDLPAKPASPSDAASATDSFDENSFYSSKAPDSTPEQGARQRPSPPSKHQVQPIDVDDLDADGLVDRPGIPMQQVDMTDSPYKTIPRPEYNAASNAQPLYLQWQNRNISQASNTVDLTAMDPDEDDEPEYSPPEPMEQFPASAANGPPRFDARDQLRRPLRRYSELDQSGNGYGSPVQVDMRIVRNHITSPLAPQPNRVSPLAVAKAPPLSQTARARKDRHRPYQNGRPESRSSPEAPTQSVHPKKKRKVEKKKGAKNGMRGNQGDQFIKDEPVSPPPFLEKRPLVPVRQNPSSDSRSVLIEDQRQELAHLPTAERYAAASPRQVVYEMDPPTLHSEPRPYSRSARPLMRDDQDLRKVASMHNLRAEPAREYTEAVYDSPLRTRATSYALLERDPPPDRPLVYHESLPPYDRLPKPEERVIRSPAPVFRDPDTGIRYERRSMMPPPQRRLVLDEYGNETIYEMVQPHRASVAPRPMRPAELEAYNDAGYASNRATSVYAESIPEKRYAQEMPPPSVTYRRVVETPRFSSVETRPIIREQQLDSSRIQRSASVQVVDYPARQPIYLDDHMEHREARMSSVRPPAPRYDDVQPREIIQRVQSARPRGREESVFIDDRPQIRREYAAVEQPRYRTMVQDGRYFELQDREPIMLDDGAEDTRRRIVQRY